MSKQEFNFRITNSCNDCHHSRSTGENGMYCRLLHPDDNMVTHETICDQFVE